MTPEDVVFAKGEPTRKNERMWLYLEKADSDYAHFALWKNGKVQAIEVQVRNSRKDKLPTIPGVSRYDTLEEIEKKLGKPDAVSTSMDNTQRMFSYLRFGLFLTLEKNELVAVGILDPKEGPMRFAEEAAKPPQ